MERELKWYWFIPLVLIYFMYDMAKWIIDGETASIRFRRLNIIILNTVFNAFVICNLIMTFIK